MKKTLAQKIEPSVDQDAELLQAMANAERREVVRQLLVSEVSVGELADIVGLSHSALSRHLAKLRGAELVTTRRVGQTIYYSCDSAKVRDVLMALRGLSASLTNGAR